MLQEIVVYVIVALALGGACRYVYRKLQALKRNSTSSACTSCPLKKNCSKSLEERKKATNSCCHAK